MCSQIDIENMDCWQRNKICDGMRRIDNEFERETVLLVGGGY